MLQASVACDYVSALYRNGAHGLLKERDSLGREYGPAFMRRYAELTPALPRAKANCGIKVLLTRTTLPRSPATLRRTPFYREVMKPQGWRHGVALCFWGDPAGELPVFVAAVYRGEGQLDFSRQDVSRLERLHPLLDCAVNRLHDREAAAMVCDGMAAAAGETRGFAVLDKSLRVTRANAVARRLWTAWVNEPAPADTARREPPLPPDLLTACRTLRASGSPS